MPGSGLGPGFSAQLSCLLQCITDRHRAQGINSSRDLPDNVLTFARRHPLMAGQVQPLGVRPLMFKRSVNYVKIAVHQEAALDGTVYTVLFLGTGECFWFQSFTVGLDQSESSEEKEAELQPGFSCCSWSV